MDRFSLVGNQEIGAIEELYKLYLQNPQEIDESWRNFFEGFELARKAYDSKSSDLVDKSHLEKEFCILNLINGYRQRGHLFTRTNPVRRRRQYSPTLDYKNFGLQESDLNQTFEAGKEIGIGASTLSTIIAHLEHTYCESIGVEYLYMRNPELIDWLKRRMESTQNTEKLQIEDQKEIFNYLKEAAGFENFIHTKFVGAKRFSLEGTEGLIPALNAIVEHGVNLGLEEYVIGISHRGRLNVLANILKKPYENIFKEFYATEYEDGIELGDVKYHLGFDKEIITKNGSKVKLSLLPNPSHLEAVAPLAEGMVRAKIDYTYEGDFNKIAPIIIHGDAAIAGQGVVYEVIQMSQLPGYKTGGTIHIVVNNQIGFTTDYLDARSSTYCTDVAKVTRSPVFHVNGDDAEAIIFTVKLALEFRQHFHSDVFIDILSYRKYGHNEGDEPRFTQPILYKAISQHPNPRDIYASKLIEAGVMTQEEVLAEIDEFNQHLEGKYELSKAIDKVKIKSFLVEEYKDYRFPEPAEIISTPTGVSGAKLKELGLKINTLPEEKKFFGKIIKILADRRQMLAENKVDWALAEQLAFASLLAEDIPVRLSGQDCERGTFSHRHAAIVMEEGTEKYFPLKSVSDDQAKFSVYNSPLNEYGVMGFEYGYSMFYPKGLTIWEAQFGDFSNVAQVVIDQYISTAGEKWGLMNGLVLFLPHGYEGQGSEHSSGRVERMLSLCTNHNMQVMMPTTPANMFHLLRRQVLGNIRIPMVVFTPKSLLRHPMVVSPIEHLSSHEFMEIILDETVAPGKAEVLIFTTGKIYYELLERRDKLGLKNQPIIRVEQLYPFPSEELRQIKFKNPKAKRVLWVQDEPANMGAWPYIARKFPELQLELICRPESASPATGMLDKHKRSLERILNAVFN
jgi:2-oxoglutarate dehydrogenase E1 component